MAEMTKMTGGSKDLVAERIDALKKLVPEAFAEGKIDFDALKGALGDAVDSSKEHYRFTWNGKEEARAFALRPSMGTLRPCAQESAGQDGTPGKFDSENLYIEGDNLEVLKLLQGAYHNAVKMIYIDPPYNTGHDFVYADDFFDSLKNYKQLTGQSDGEGRATHANAETSGRYHTDWLNMMFPRLLLARNLLREDGIIFVSIGEHEIDNLKKMCSEVFGESNFIETYVWESTFRPDNSSPIMRRNAEYILCYAKRIEMVKKLIGEIKEKEGLPSLTKTSMAESVLKFPANKVQTFLANGHYVAGVKDSYELLDDVDVQDGIIVNEFRLKGHVIWSQANLDREMEEGTEVIIKSEGFVPYTKKPGDSVMSPAKLIPNNLVGDVLSANAEFSELFEKKVFSYPKPVTLLKYLVKYFEEKDFIVLDFFSGSSTTAHAVLRQNFEDAGCRHFIMTQLPEDLDQSFSHAKDATEKAIIGNAISLCEEKHVAHRLTEIGKERIRRAGRKILEEVKRKSEEGRSGEGLFAEANGGRGATALPDVGFKVFKLDTSNLILWNPNPDDLKASLLAVVDNAVEGRTADDLLYEILLKCNLPLTLAVEKRAFGTNTIAVVGEGALMICLDQTITASVAEEMVRLRDEVYKPAVAMQVVFRDGGFTDKEKANAIATLVQAGVEERAILSI